MIVQPAPPEHYGWIAERADLIVTPQFRALEVVDADGRIHAMAGFDGWTPNGVNMHVALENAAALRHLIRPAFGVVFDEPPFGVGKGVAVGMVRSNNLRALQLDLHLGFKECGRIHDAWGPGVDLIFLEMKRSECRWLRQAVKEAA